MYKIDRTCGVGNRKVIYMYWRKADQCAQKAQDVSGSQMYGIYKAQEKAWRNIAERLELLAFHGDEPQDKVSGIGWPRRLLQFAFKLRGSPLI